MFGLGTQEILLILLLVLILFGAKKIPEIMRGLEPDRRATRRIR